jgi:hypothetical protein
MAETKDPQQQTPAQQDQWANSPARKAWAEDLLKRAHNGVAIEDSAVSEMKKLLNSAQAEVAKILQDYNGQGVPEWRLNRVNQQIAALERLGAEWDAKVGEIAKRHLDDLVKASQGLPQAEQKRIADAIANAQQQLDAAAKGVTRGIQGERSVPVPTARMNRGGAGMVYADPRYVSIASQYVPEQIKDSIGKLKAAVKQEIIRNSLALDTPEASMARLTSVATPIGAFPTATVRAEAIVRTEFGRVSQIANMSAIAQMAQNPYGIPGDASIMTDANGFVYKEWIAVGDSRTREEHAALDGVIIRYDEPFMVGEFPAQYPKDPSLPAKHAVNCRCMVVPAFPPELADQMGKIGGDVNGMVPSAGMGDYLDAALNGEPVPTGGAMVGDGIAIPADVSVLDPGLAPDPYGGVIPLDNASQGLTADGTPIAAPIEPLAGTQLGISMNGVRFNQWQAFLPGRRTSQLGVSDIVFGRVTDILRRVDNEVTRVAKSVARPGTLKVNPAAEALLQLVKPQKGGKRLKKAEVPARDEIRLIDELPPIALVIKDAPGVAAKDVDAANIMLSTKPGYWKDYLTFLATELERRNKAAAEGKTYVPGTYEINSKTLPNGESLVVEYDIDAWAKLPDGARQYILRSVTSQAVRDSGQNDEFMNNALLQALWQRGREKARLLTEAVRLPERTAEIHAIQISIIQVIENAIGKQYPDWANMPTKDLYVALTGETEGGDTGAWMVRDWIQNADVPNAVVMLERVQQLRKDPAFEAARAKAAKETHLSQELSKAIYDNPEDLLNNLKMAEENFARLVRENPEPTGEVTPAERYAREEKLRLAHDIVTSHEAQLHQWIMFRFNRSGYEQTLFQDIIRRMERNGVNVHEDFGAWWVNRELQNPDSQVSQHLKWIKRGLRKPTAEDRANMVGDAYTEGSGSTFEAPQQDAINPMTSKPYTDQEIIQWLNYHYSKLENVVRTINHTAATKQFLSQASYDTSNGDLEAMAVNLLLLEFATERGVTSEMILGTSRANLVARLFREGRLVTGRNSYIEYNSVNFSDTVEAGGVIARDRNGARAVSYFAFLSGRTHKELHKRVVPLGGTNDRTVQEDSLFQTMDYAEPSPQEVTDLLAGFVLRGVKNSTHLFGGVGSTRSYYEKANSFETLASRQLKELFDQWGAAIRLEDSQKARMQTALLTDRVTEDPLQYEDVFVALAKRAVDSGMADPNDPIIQQWLRTRRMQDMDLSNPTIVRVMYGLTERELPKMAAEAIGFSLDPQLVSDVMTLQALTSDARGAMISEQPDSYSGVRDTLIGRLGITSDSEMVNDMAERLRSAQKFVLRAVLSGGYTKKLQKQRMGGFAPQEGFMLKKDDAWRQKPIAVLWHEMEFMIQETIAKEALARGVAPEETIVPNPVTIGTTPTPENWQDLTDEQQIDFAKELVARHKALLRERILPQYLNADGVPTRKGELLLKTVTPDVLNEFKRKGSPLPSDPAEAIKAIIDKLATPAIVQPTLIINNNQSPRDLSLGHPYYVIEDQRQEYITPTDSWGVLRPDTTRYSATSAQDAPYYTPISLAQMIEHVTRVRAAHQMALQWAADDLRLKIKDQLNNLMQGDLRAIKQRKDWRAKMQQIVDKAKEISAQQRRAAAAGVKITDELVNEAFKLLDKELETFISTLSEDEFIFVKDPRQVEELKTIRAEIQARLEGTIEAPKYLGGGVSGSFVGKIDGKKVIIKQKKKLSKNTGVRDDWGIPPTADLFAEKASQIIDELGGLFIGKAQATTRDVPATPGATDPLPADQSLVMDWLTGGWVAKDVGYSRLGANGDLVNATNYDLMSIYDALIGNTDRHAGNYLLAPVIDPANPQLIDKDGYVVDSTGTGTGEPWTQFKIIPIDNGLSFPDATVHDSSAWGNMPPWLQEKPLNQRQTEVLLRLWKNRTELHRQLSAIMNPGQVRGVFYRLIWMLVKKSSMDARTFSRAGYNPEGANSDGVVSSVLSNAQSVLDARVSATGEPIAPGQIDLGIEP